MGDCTEMVIQTDYLRKGLFSVATELVPGFRVGNTPLCCRIFIHCTKIRYFLMPVPFSVKV
jgi:hypothetical protein